MKTQSSAFRTLLMLVLLVGLMVAPLTASAHGPGGRGHNSSIWQLSGVLTARPTAGNLGEWAIEGETFIVNESTFIDDDNSVLFPGAYVHASGYRDNAGSRIAVRVEARYGNDGDSICIGNEGWRIYGLIEAMPTEGLIGTWNIGGQTLLSTEDTVFQQNWGELAPGTLAMSVGTFDENDQRVALMISAMPETAMPTFANNAQWHLYGQIETLPDGLIGIWTVSGSSFVTTADTWFGPRFIEPQPGDTVHVVGSYDETGTAVAYRVMLSNAGNMGSDTCGGPGDMGPGDGQSGHGGHGGHGGGGGRH